MSQGKRKQWAILLLSLLLIVGFSKITLAADIPSDRLRLTAPDAYGNIPFSVVNMFPGDSVTKDFTVKVKHKQPITLYYRAEIQPGSEKLGEVMMVKVELPDKGLTLYDGLMRDMPSALEHRLAASEKEVVYRITAYLDTSVGNEYQLQELVADFRWWYAEEPDGGDSGNGVGDGGNTGDGSGSTGGGTTGGETTGSSSTGGGGYTEHSQDTGGAGNANDEAPKEPDPSGFLGVWGSPKTGDDSHLVWYAALFAGSVALLILLLVLMRKKKEEQS